MDWFLKLLGVSAKNRKIIKDTTNTARVISRSSAQGDAAQKSAMRKTLSETILDIEDLPYDEYEIVGESHYQATLEKHACPKTEAGADCQCEAPLICERGNKFDKNAVRIELQGELVGYLSRADAEAFREMLDDEDARGAKVRAKARITGGWKRNDDEGHFGIELDFE